MQFEDLVKIFSAHEETFYRYLVPWVVNDLRTNDVPEHLRVKIPIIDNETGESMLDFDYNPIYLFETVARKIFKQKGSIDYKAKEIIKYSVERYFEYLFPFTEHPSGINIKYFKQQTLKKIEQDMSKQHWYQTIFDYVKNDVDLDVNFSKHVDRLKATIQSNLNVYKENLKYERLKQIIDNVVLKKYNDHKSYKQFIGLKPVKDLNITDATKLQQAYEYYDQKYKSQARVGTSEDLINVIDNVVLKKYNDFKSYKEFKNLKPVKDLNITDDTILLQAHKYYDQKFKERMQSIPGALGSLKSQSAQTKRRTINSRIVINDLIEKEESEEFKNPELTIEEFDDLTRKYRTKSETIERLYAKYLELRNLKSVKYNVEYQKFEPHDVFYKNVTHQVPNIPPGRYYRNYFPLKSNIKEYSLHAIAPKYSYIIDLMFENRTFCYLVAININTKKLWVRPTNVIEKIELEKKENDDDDEFQERLDKAYEVRITKEMKSTKNYLKALNDMIKSGMIVKYLKGDGEKAFKSEEAMIFYYNKGINENRPIIDSKTNKRLPMNEFIPVARQITKYPDFMQELNMVKKLKSEPTHSSLGIIDRVIRTIRDIAYKSGVKEINPRIMNDIVNLYNNTPHSTLSKYAGMPVTPNDVDDENPELEAFIVRKIQQENFNIMSKFGFNLYPNQEVVVYNVPSSMAKRRSVIEPGSFKIKQRLGNLYQIIDQDGKTREISRYKIHPK